MQLSIAFKSHTAEHDIERLSNHISEISKTLNYVSQPFEELLLRAMPWRVQNSAQQLPSPHSPATTLPNKSMQIVCVTALMPTFLLLR